MEAAKAAPGSLRAVPPHSALRGVPAQNRRKLCELNGFFLENFRLNDTGNRFCGFARELAGQNSWVELGYLYTAAKFISEAKKLVEPVASLEPTKLMPLLDDKATGPALFLSVLKALDNAALGVDATLVRDLFAFHNAVFQNSWGKSRIMTSGAFLAMLENPKCATDWVTENTAFRLATLSNNIVTKDTEENDKRFISLAAELRKPTFSVENLDALADRISKPLCRDTWPELQERK